MLEAILISGPNGAGKTTFAREVLRLRNPQMVFLNADEIQRESSALHHPVSAGRELLRRLDQLEQDATSFAVETTLSSQSYARRIETWSDLGYRTTLHFIELPSAEYAIDRVSRRVAAGGHAIPAEDVRRRFDRGLHPFEAVFKPLFDRWYHWFSDDGGLQFVAKAKSNSDQEELELLLEAARRATWDALHGPRHLRSGRFNPVPDDEAEENPATAEQGIAPDNAAPRR